MLFKGDFIEVLPLAEGLVELRFDRCGGSINKLDAGTMREFMEASAAIARSADVRGVLLTSAKDVFIVGADILEFGATFQMPEAKIAVGVRAGNASCCVFEDLEIPSVAAINGFALGGGLEVALMASLRVMAETAAVGLPEVSLGLIPGLGGTVRLPRVAGLATAMEWVASGKPAKAPAALAAGVVSEVAPAGELRDRALALLRRAAVGEVDWKAARQRKRSAMAISAHEAAEVAEVMRAKLQHRIGSHQPAAMLAIQMMADVASRERDGALDLEATTFARIAKTQAASSLVQAFVNDQALKKLYKGLARAARPVKQGAVLGAGTMGGGIAVTSALRGVPVRMKDITQSALDIGMAEAGKQLAKQVKAGRLTAEKAEAIRASIVPQRDEAGFDQVECVIEAIVESLDVKRQVLAALEGAVRADTVIASNTSSLRIDDIAQALTRPENFVGMHFFNPVPAMQLVEVIRGTKTSDATVSTAVGYAVAMGKTPVVVKDCPGFLVNRILAAYVNGFLQLVADGANFEAVDRAMEAFGWPMGPAYLQDVVGMDVGAHVGDVIAAGYPKRMPPIERNALTLMVAKQRYGQKNGAGFYRYENDATGKPRKSADPRAHALIATLQPGGPREFDDAEIVERTMLPLIVEAAHALEEGVVATPAELDMALLLAVGFPAYTGGALKYADWLGLERVVALCDKHAALGPRYAATQRMREMAARDERYYRV